jgi:hypothetical protein
MSDDAKNLAKGLLGAVLYDLLKEGWVQTAPMLADLIGMLPFAQFATLARANTAPGRDVTSSEYDEWIDTLLMTAVYFRRHADTLGENGEYWYASQEEIAAVAAEQLVDTAGRQNRLEVDELMGITKGILGHMSLAGSLRVGRVGARRPNI